MKNLFRIIALLMLLSSVEAAEITDMHGRKVALPGPVKRVVGASPPVTYLVYTIDPGLVIGLNLPFDEKARRFLRPETFKLPVIGGFGGQGRNFNVEAFLATKPDLVLAWPQNSATLKPKVEQTLADFKIPCIYVTLDDLADYPAAYEFLGNVLGRKERAHKLAAYFQAELKKMEAFSGKIPEGKRISVYFAEDPDGLTTVSSESAHAEAVTLAGGRNVHQMKEERSRRKERISIEQVLSYNPDVIIVQDRTFFESVYADSRWKGIAAVRNHRVYLIPDSPFNWMDKPPSFMRLMGAKWLASVLNPSSFKVNLVAETREFYRIFLAVELSEHLAGKAALQEAAAKLTERLLPKLVVQ